MTVRHVSHYIANVMDDMSRAQLAQAGKSGQHMNRTQAQSMAIAQHQAAGYAITKEHPSKVELTRAGSIIVVLQDGTVRRGQSAHQSGSRGNGQRRFA